MENQANIGALLSGLSNNPALLGILSSLIGGASENAPVDPPPPKPQQPTAAGGIDPNLIAVLNGLLSAGAPPNHTDNRSSANCAPSRDTCTDEKGASGALQKMLGGKTECENRIRLLNALRPYLGEERREKVDLLLKLLKLAELGQLSGLLNSF